MEYNHPIFSQRLNHLYSHRNKQPSFPCSRNLSALRSPEPAGQKMCPLLPLYSEVLRKASPTRFFQADVTRNSNNPQILEFQGLRSFPAPSVCEGSSLIQLPDHSLRQRESHNPVRCIFPQMSSLRIPLLPLHSLHTSRKPQARRISPCQFRRLHQTETWMLSPPYKYSLSAAGSQQYHPPDFPVLLHLPEQSDIAYLHGHRSTYIRPYNSIHRILSRKSDPL